MIYDGRTRFASVHGDNYVYRPLMRHERKCLESLLRDMPEHLSEKLERHVVEEQIVVADWGIPLCDMDDETYRDVAWRVLGYAHEQEEIDDEENLNAAMALYAEYPWLRTTSCDSCRKWLYDPLTGHLYRNNVDGEMVPQERPAGWPLACDSGACPKGHWSKPIELSERNKLALAYRESCQV